jgi:glycosyltransferase involved in cell wall biosynthesis
MKHSKNAAAPHLALFFTKRISLRKWDRIGIFDRETALYQRVQRLGVRVSFITYGGPSDLAYRDRLPGIEIACNRWRLPHALYARWLPWLHGDVLKSCSAIKTNQTPGGDAVLRAARRFGKPLVARCGYLASEFSARSHGAGSARHLRDLAVERRLFTAAARVVVTTEEMAKQITRDTPGIDDRIRIIPNYVETDRFRPLDEIRQRHDLVFLGRLAPQKNLESLLEAIRPLNASLLVIGGGDIPLWRERYRDLQDRVTWKGSVPHGELPALMRSARVFVLPSHYEGHPKALLEALACGLPVIGADSPGIREVLRHKENGWLSSADSASLRNSIQALLSDTDLQVRLGRAARAFAEQRYSLAGVAQLELSVLQEVLHGKDQAMAG